MADNLSNLYTELTKSSEKKEKEDNSLVKKKEQKSIKSEKTPDKEAENEIKTTEHKKANYKDIHIFKDPLNPMWVSVAEASKMGGITTKTIRRALTSKKISYKVYKNRYLINFTSVLNYLNTSKKLKNKLNEYGIGQYIEKWRSIK